MTWQIGGLFPSSKQVFIKYLLCTLHCVFIKYLLCTLHS